MFVAGLSQHEFPSYRSIADRGEDGAKEELRLFYVAVTRARNSLILTGHARSDHGKVRQPSEYFCLIGDNWVEVDSRAITRACRR